MSILSEFEDRVGSALEGVFAGVFRSPVQPVELARALGKAMDDGRSVGAGKVYAPLGYTVALSHDDSDKFGSFKATLSGELSTYLADHARERGYHLTAVPNVAFTVHDDLRLGRFRVSAELAAPELVAAKQTVPEPTPDPGPRPVDTASHETPFDWAAPGPTRDAASSATVTVGEGGHTVALRGETVVAGRLATSGIRLADANASREHAAFIRDGGSWAIQDLASTNGTSLNGVPVSRERLHDGDIVGIGLTRLTFHEPRR